MTVKLGYSIAYAGFFTMLSLSMYAPGSIISSKLSDIYPRKTIMIVTQILCGLAMIVTGLFMNNKEIVPFLLLSIFFFDGATDPARTAIHADHTTFQNRKEAFSLFYFAFNIGFAVGPMVAGILFYKYPQWLFIGNGLVTLCSTLLVMILIEDKKPTTEELELSIINNQSDKAVEGSVWKALKERPLLTIYLLISSAAGLARAFIFFAIPLFFNELFLMKGPTYYGSIMSINAITVIVFTPIIVKLSNNRHPLRDISMSLLLYSLSYFIMGYASSYIYFAALMVLATIGEVLSATNYEYFFTNQTPMGHRARFSSVRLILEGSGFAIGPLLAGIIINDKGYTFIFLSSAIILLGCAIALQFLRLAYKKKTNNKY
ncbi:MAG: MFS transporter [Spirochaetaceae bacterium]|nr:MFS transporter [Spirochaetaceae bacterium]